MCALSGLQAIPYVAIKYHRVSNRLYIIIHRCCWLDFSLCIVGPNCIVLKTAASMILQISVVSFRVLPDR